MASSSLILCNFYTIVTCNYYEWPTRILSFSSYPGMVCVSFRPPVQWAIYVDPMHRQHDKMCPWSSFVSQCLCKQQDVGKWKDSRGTQCRTNPWYSCTWPNSIYVCLCGKTCTCRTAFILSSLQVIYCTVVNYSFLHGQKMADSV